jgi:hypothetical protein
VGRFEASHLGRQLAVASIEIGLEPDERRLALGELTRRAERLDIEALNSTSRPIGDIRVLELAAAEPPLAWADWTHARQPERGLAREGTPTRTECQSDER